MIENITAPKTSHIDGFGYNSISKVLTVKYASGSSYNFTGVPLSVWIGLKAAPSKGKYMNANIKGKFDGKKA